MTIGEKLSLAGSMIIRGLGTVFLVLVILMAVIVIFGAVAKLSQEKKDKKPAPADTKQAAPVAAPAETVPASDDGAIVAAIMAAIEVFRAEEGLPAGSYRVVSFKKRATRRSLED